MEGGFLVKQSIGDFSDPQPRWLVVDQMDDVQDGVVAAGTTHTVMGYGVGLDDQNRQCIWVGGPLTKVAEGQRIEISREGVDLNVHLLPRA